METRNVQKLHFNEFFIKTVAYYWYLGSHKKEGLLKYSSLVKK